MKHRRSYYQEPIPHRDSRLMKAGIRDRWIRALTSGDFDQLVGMPFMKLTLSNGISQYNALGVLCEIMEIPSVSVPIGPTGAQYVKFDDEACYLSSRVCALAGITPDRGPGIAKIYVDDAIQLPAHDIKSLSEAGWSFERLAEIIEDQL